MTSETTELCVGDRVKGDFGEAVVTRVEAGKVWALYPGGRECWRSKTSPWELVERSRTEGAPVEPRPFQVGDVVRQESSVGGGKEFTVAKVDGDYLWFPWNGDMNDLVWTSASNCTLVTPAPAPEPRATPRAFVVGDRVHLKPDGVAKGIVDYVVNDEVVRVRWDHDSIGHALKSHLTLVTPAPEEPAPDREGNERPCDECDAATGGPEYRLCDDCCQEHCLADIGICPHCGCRPNGYVEPKPRAYDEGGTNPAGFPTMPERTVAGVVLCGECHKPTSGTVTVLRSDGVRCHEGCLSALAGTASAVLPFDAWLAERECREPEVPPHDIREGDIVEGQHYDDDDTRSKGIVESTGPHGVYVRTRDGFVHYLRVSTCTVVRRGERGPA